MSAPTDSRYWVDILDRKHECGPYLSSHVRLDVDHGGSTLHVWMPKTLPEWNRLKILTTAEAEGRLFLLASHRMRRHDSDGRGIVMIARRYEDGDYVVHVWHELYPWALTHLGLPAPDSVEESRS